MGSIIALPGFLGVDDDWSSLLPAAIIPKDLPVASLKEWTSLFCAWAEKLPAPRILAGYSLGGRLALHALCRKPQLWTRAFILSANPGLNDPFVKQQRLREDLKWADRFLNNPWNELMKDWNSRGALKSSPPLVLQESNYCRNRLAAELDFWSLGRQEDLKPQIEILDIPITWIVGGLDQAFLDIALTLKFKHQESRTVIVPDAGHRLLHEKPHVITKELLWKH